MSSSLWVEGDVPKPIVDELAQKIDGHTDLKTVLDAWHGTTPPRKVVDVVTQDEYTHDVIIQYDDAVYLVYDAT